MLTNIQNRIAFSNKNAELEEMLGGESLTGFVDGLSRSASSVAGAIGDWFKSDTPSVASRPEPVGNVVHLMKEYPSKSLAKLNIYTPAELEVYHEDFYTELLVQLNELHDVEDRLYKPVINWLARCITDPEYGDKVWVDRKIEFVPLEKHTKQMSKMFDKQPASTGDPTLTSFSNCYRNVRDFEKSFDALSDLTNLCLDVNIESLRDREKRLAELIKKFVKGYEDGVIFASEVNMTRLIKIVDSAARETEYVAAIMYYANITIEAHNQTVKKLASDLV